jgi:DNA-binding NarL/FixJ family response regulator
LALVLLVETQDILDQDYMRSLKVGVVDDHELFLRSFVLLLTTIKSGFDITVAVESLSEDDFLAKLRQNDLDLVFLDLNLTKSDGIRLIPKIKERNPETKVLIVSMSTEAKVVRESFQQGADGYLSKYSDLDNLVEGIREVMDGEIFFGKGIEATQKISSEVVKQTSTPMLNRFNAKFHLTKRESEILEKMTEGKSSKTIAAELFISKETVSVHRKNLMRKLGASNALNLLKIARDYNLI